MNSRMLRNLVLVLTAMVAFSTLASAQLPAFRGKFTLPVDSRWGLATLPAGEYYFRLESSSYPFMVTVSGNGTTAIVFARRMDDPISDKSELVLVRDGKKGAIRSMTLPTLGTFYYPPGKDEPQYLARAPKMIQRVPIKPEGK